MRWLKHEDRGVVKTTRRVLGDQIGKKLSTSKANGTARGTESFERKRKPKAGKTQELPHFAWIFESFFARRIGLL